MESLPQLLQAVLSVDNAQRAAAERQIDSLSTAPGFLLTLVNLCCENLNTAPVPTLMVALSVLKQKMSRQSAANDLCGVARALLECVVFGGSSPDSEQEGQASSLVRHASAVITRAILLLECQIDKSQEDDLVDPAVSAAAARDLSVLLAFAFDGMAGILSPFMTMATTTPSSMAVGDEDPLPARVFGLLQEMADVLPDHNCVTRNDYLLSVVPAMFRIAVSETPLTLLQDAGSHDGVVAATRRLRLQISAAQLLVTLYTHAAGARKFSAELGGNAGTLPDSAPFASLGGHFVDALQRGLASRLAGLRLSAISAQVQRLLSSASTTSLSRPVNELLLFVELECQLLSLVSVAGKLAVGKSEQNSPSACAFAPEFTRALYTALEQDVAAYHAALRLSPITDMDEDSKDSYGDYERTHGDSDLLDREEALQAYGSKVRKCSELRWRLLEAAAAASASPAKAARKKMLRVIHTPECLTDSEKAYNELCHFMQIFLQYAYLSFRNATVWVENPNEFLRQEDEKDLLWTLRDVAALTMRRHCRVLGDYFTQIAAETLFGVLAVAPHEDTEHPPEVNAQRREAAMFLMESLLRNCRKQVMACGEADYSPLVSSLLANDVASGNTVVAARALTLLGALLTFLARTGWRHGRNVGQQCAQVLPAAVASLSLTSNIQPLIRVCACKLLLELIPLTPTDALLEGFTVLGGQQALLQLLGGSPCPSVLPSPAQSADVVSGESLYLVLDVLSAWLAKLRSCSTSFSTADHCSPSAHTALFACWRRHLQDPNVDEALLSVFSEYTRSPAGDDAFAAELPWLRHLLLSGRDAGPSVAATLCSVPAGVRLLAQVFAHGSARAADATACAVLDSLCVLLLSTDESAILAAASSCLAALLRRCPQAESVHVLVPPSLLSAAARDVSAGDGEYAGSVPSTAAFDEESVTVSLTTVLLAVVLRMLAPQRKEASLLDVGNALVAVVEYAPHFCSDEVHRLVGTIAHRLETVRTPSVMQQLIAPLSVLLKLYPEAFLQWFREAGMLERIFALWLPQVSDFFGKRDILRSCEAFVGLLANWTQSGLQGVVIPWEKATGSSGKVQKRGKVKTAKQAGVGGAVQLPLDVALFCALGQSIVVLADMLESGEWWEMDKMEKAETEGAAGGRLWQENDLDSEEDDDSEYEDFDDDDESGCGNGEVTPMTQGQNASTPQQATPMTKHDRAKQQLRPVFGEIAPLLNQYGNAVAPFFSPDELSSIQEFLQFVLSP